MKYLRMTCVTLALLAGFAGRTQAADTPPAAGHWEGAIQTPGPELNIIVDLSARPDGTWEGTISIPTQNLKAFPLSDLVIEGQTVAFAMKGIAGDPRFKGTVANEPRSLTGELTQGGATMPFKLAWKGEAQIVPPAKSTLVTEDLLGSWQGTLRTNGTTLRLIVKLANVETAATGTLTSVDQGGVELPITTITQAGTNLTLVVATVQGRFEGAMKDGRLEGTWTQGPLTLPLVFERVVAK